VKRELEKLARHRLGRAKEAFAEGEHLLTKSAFMGAVNRFYYAAFYVARSLLAPTEVDSSRGQSVQRDSMAMFGMWLRRYSERMHRGGLALTETP
jgi:uncharacterized protein (UPF0332 family)